MQAAPHRDPSVGDGIEIGDEARRDRKRVGFDVHDLLEPVQHCVFRSGGEGSIPAGEIVDGRAAEIVRKMQQHERRAAATILDALDHAQPRPRRQARRAVVDDQDLIVP
jgi:hypothetical protein